jgi:nitroimidazol reductase NimA-like FMN-containing flavoprotein (pyridoxamine 5'-phosphate oxidase superfamily)
MRRKDKELTDRAAIDAIISRARVCRIGLCDEGIPYIVPMCFGYEDDAIYLHCAREGRKIDFIRNNPTVCFEFDIDAEVKKSDKPCSFSMKYRSVMGYGEAAFVEDPEGKSKALGIIMRQYDQGHFSYPDESLKNIAVIRIAITEITGKKSGY